MLMIFIEQSNHYHVHGEVMVVKTTDYTLTMSRLGSTAVHSTTNTVPPHAMFSS